MDKYQRNLISSKNNTDDGSFCHPNYKFILSLVIFVIKFSSSFCQWDWICLYSIHLNSSLWNLRTASLEIFPTTSSKSTFKQVVKPVTVNRGRKILSSEVKAEPAQALPAAWEAKIEPVKSNKLKLHMILLLWSYKQKKKRRLLKRLKLQTNFYIETFFLGLILL
jgi:hypothetical protein